MPHTRLRRSEARTRRRFVTLLVVSALTVAGSQLGLSIASAGEDPVCADGQHAEAGICVPDTIDTSSVITGPTGATAEASDPTSEPTGPTDPTTGPSSNDGGKGSGQPNDGPSGPASGTFQTQDKPDDSGRHIDICHATGSGKYQSISPSISATGDISGGHQNHDDDIIPPFDTDGDTTGITSKNWDADGQATWENDCVPPEGEITISKVANVDGAVSPGDSFTYTITVTNTFETSRSVTMTDGVPSAFEVTGATSSDLSCETTGNSV